MLEQIAARALTAIGEAIAAARRFPVHPQMDDVDWMPIVGDAGDLAIITTDAKQRF